MPATSGMKTMRDAVRTTTPRSTSRSKAKKVISATKTTTSRKLVPQRVCSFGKGRISETMRGRLRLVGVDGHVLRAVVLEDAPDIGDEADERDVADKEHEPEDAFDSRRSRSGGRPTLRGGWRAGSARRRRCRRRTGAASTIVPENTVSGNSSGLPSSVSSSNAMREEKFSARMPSAMVSQSTTTPRMSGTSRAAAGVDAGELFGVGDDVALGVAHGDGHVLGAADHDAFHDRLATEVDVICWCRGPDRFGHWVTLQIRKRGAGWRP